MKSRAQFWDLGCLWGQSTVQTPTVSIWRFHLLWWEAGSASHQAPQSGNLQTCERVPPKNTENETRLPPSPHLHVQRGRSPPGVQVSGGSLQVSPAQPPLLPPLPSARLISHSPHGSRPQSPPSLADRPVQEARKQFSKPLEKTVDLDLSGFQHLSKKNCYFPFKHHAN